MRAFLRLSYVTLYMTRKTSFAPFSRSVLIQGVRYSLRHGRTACCSFTLRCPHYRTSNSDEGYSFEIEPIVHLVPSNSGQTRVTRSCQSSAVVCCAIIFPVSSSNTIPQRPQRYNFPGQSSP